MTGESPAYTAGELTAIRAAARKERRERIATAAMQGMAANWPVSDRETEIAVLAVRLAAALIAELDR